MKKVLKNIHFQPAQILALGFFGLIIVGTILLDLPIASNDGQSIGIVNALFTSTSAVCVTGLVIANSMEQWTLRRSSLERSCKTLFVNRNKGTT